jgi:predicted membrane channel-forming protein YqfA (hemolysin III family)
MIGRSWILISASLALVVLVLSLGPIGQDQAYHAFADQRTLLNVPNGANVLSNVLFVIAGLWGAVFTMCGTAAKQDRMLRIQYGLFFFGVFLSGIGSMYYHLAPSDATLVWDRLPMSVAFMALVASLLSECVDRRAGSVLLLPLVIFGIASVLYWAWTEGRGSGDLRPYIIVQFLPVLLVPPTLVLYRPPKDYAAGLWTLVALYVVAKAFEHFDCQVFVLLGIVSGHTIKHIVAAIGAGAVLGTIIRRTAKAS